MRRFVIGDIHGAYRALISCLKKANFDYNQDELIVLGDVCDGWSEFIECMEELSKIKNLILLRGNHDDWTLAYLKGKLVFKMSSEGTSWLAHGGGVTKDKIDSNPDKKQFIIDFIESSKFYHIDDNNNLFVHAGFDLKKPITEQSNYTLIWDRNFIVDIIAKAKHNFNHVYVGHTPTDYITEGHFTPMSIGNKTVTLMDTGAAFDGPLTLMNIDTKEIYQDYPKQLYPNENGRN